MDIQLGMAIYKSCKSMTTNRGTQLYLHDSYHKKNNNLTIAIPHLAILPNRIPSINKGNEQSKFTCMLQTFNNSRVPIQMGIWFLIDKNISTDDLVAITLYLIISLVFPAPKDDRAVAESWSKKSNTVQAMKAKRKKVWSPKLIRYDPSLPRIAGTPIPTLSPAGSDPSSWRLSAPPPATSSSASASAAWVRLSEQQEVRRRGRGALRDKRRGAACPLERRISGRLGLRGVWVRAAEEIRGDCRRGIWNYCDTSPRSARRRHGCVFSPPFSKKPKMERRAKS